MGTCSSAPPAQWSGVPISTASPVLTPLVLNRSASPPGPRKRGGSSPGGGSTSQASQPEGRRLPSPVSHPSRRQPGVFPSSPRPPVRHDEDRLNVLCRGQSPNLPRFSGVVSPSIGGGATSTSLTPRSSRASSPSLGPYRTVAGAGSVGRPVPSPSSLPPSGQRLSSRQGSTHSLPTRRSQPVMGEDVNPSNGTAEGASFSHAAPWHAGDSTTPVPGLLQATNTTASSHSSSTGRLNLTPSKQEALRQRAALLQRRVEEDRQRAGIS